MIHLKTSSPKLPLPMLSCLSTLEAKAFLESFRCIPLRNLKPIISSNSSQVCLNPCLLFKSYPAEKAWQVSIQTPTLVLSSIFSMMSAICSKENPKFVPWPAVFSITAITFFVLSRAILIDSAMVFMHFSSDTFFRKLPG